MDAKFHRVPVVPGHANVEVDQIYPQNTILVDLDKGQTQLLKNGLYSFDAANSTVRVFDGKAAVPLLKPLPPPKKLLADEAYDCAAFRDRLSRRGTTPIIPRFGKSSAFFASA